MNRWATALTSIPGRSSWGGTIRLALPASMRLMAAPAARAIWIALPSSPSVPILPCPMRLGANWPSISSLKTKPPPVNTTPFRARMCTVWPKLRASKPITAPSRSTTSRSTVVSGRTVAPTASARLARCSMSSQPPCPGVATRWPRGAGTARTSNG